MNKKTPRVVTFYFEWANTAGNHAGMAYFARCFKRDLGFPVKLIRIPTAFKTLRNRFQLLFRYMVIRYSTFNLRRSDIFFFMEYLGGRQCGDHRAIALDLRARGIKNRLIGLVHLPMSSLLKLYDKEYISTALDVIDDIVVFGSSLAADMEQLGYSDKIRHTFYYADTNYYHPAKIHVKSTEFIAIVMGFLYRNRNLLKEIIECCPKITFELCLGNNKQSHSMFSQYPNVVCNGFMTEQKLLDKMQNANVSLSVMHDTVGSNVITTSLSCGLPQIVSDVGSIRDYCSDENAFFCKNINDFVNAIQTLSQNPDICRRMSHHARIKAETISLEKSIEWYGRLFFSSSYEKIAIE